MDKRERSPLFIPLTTGEETKSRWEADHHKVSGNTPFYMHQGIPSEVEKNTGDSKEVYKLYNCMNSWHPPSPEPSDDVPSYIDRISQSLFNLIESSGFSAYFEDADAPVVPATTSFAGRAPRKSILRTPFSNDSRMESPFNITNKSVSFQPTFKCFGCDIVTDSPKFFKEHLEKHLRPPKDLHRLARQMDKQLHEEKPTSALTFKKRRRSRVHTLIESDRLCTTEATNGSLNHLDTALLDDDDDDELIIANRNNPAPVAQTKMLPVLSTTFKKTRKPYKKRSGLVVKSVSRRRSYRNTIDQFTAPPRTSTLLADKAGLDNDFFGAMSDFGTIGNTMITDVDETLASKGGTKTKQYKLPRTTCTVCNKNYTSKYIKVHKMKAHHITDQLDVPTLCSNETSNSKEQVTEISQPPAQVHQSKSMENQSLSRTKNHIKSFADQRVKDWINQLPLPSPIETEPGSPQIVDNSDFPDPISQPATSRILAFKKPIVNASCAPLSHKEVSDAIGLLFKNAHPYKKPVQLGSSNASNSGRVSSVSKKPFMVYNSQKSFNVYSTNAPKSSPLIVFQSLKRGQNQQAAMKDVNIIKQEPNSLEKMEQEIRAHYLKTQKEKQAPIPELINSQQISDTPKLPNDDDVSPCFYFETPTIANANMNKCRRIL